ncbi:carbohydrate ABC transporter membrane protein 2 (CUT1 family) [Haloactinopolyspora alba]|uniref:Carbohydrate ABC transporter membrane protein 2 (CUT1 family) n=2 Tax=Haloactinopolyspora alba TaxID=648780 RepID=A0A2P8E6Q6_9ACTN|nr:carbohydrate ABC transporter permease [Haloactinopolyspora alba]PSL05146.1 carbohydrate ABC transporter membrane protein 2 (CUT1 family) [Haloactinopolyspora alba]
MTDIAAPPRRRRRLRTGSLVVDLVLLSVGVIMVAPLVWLISSSLTAASAAFSLPPTWIPRPFSLQNFADVPELVPFGRMALNSLLVATISTAGALLVSVLAAYAFSRLSFRGSRALFVALLSALMVPTQLTIIPVFILMRNLGLVDTLTALWLPTLINVFAIFFLRQYFNSIPKELDDAARIDGAGHLWILFRMLVPLSGPALAALSILLFEMSWNNYFNPLIFISTPEKMTLPLGLVTLQSGQGGGSPAVVVFAAITLVVLPVLILFLLFQRSFVTSIASTGIRG